MNLSTVITTTTSHSVVAQLASKDGRRRSSITTSTTEQFASGPYEVVYREKTTEDDGSEDVLTLHYAYDDTNSTLFDENAATESLLMISEGKISEKDISKQDKSCHNKLTRKSSEEFSLCPHKSVLHLPTIATAEQARDQMKLICMQAQLGYMLLGVMGERKLEQFGYPNRSVIEILQLVLDKAKTKVVEETYNCSEECGTLDASIDQNQLAYRLIKLRIHVLRANIGKLLCLCVPEREKWTEFGWDGKTVDEILDDLSKLDIPTHHPGDLEVQKMLMAQNIAHQNNATEDKTSKKDIDCDEEEVIQLDQDNFKRSSSRDCNELDIVTESIESESDEYIEVVDAEDEIKSTVC